MAGQPSEPSFQSSDQDQGQTQGRPAWQPGYDPNRSTPPGGLSDGGGGGRAYAAPPPSYSDPGYAGPGGHDQTFTAPPGQAYGRPDQGFTAGGPGQAYQPGYQAPPGQFTASPPPQWNAETDAASATPGARSREHGEKGFLGSLFDFSFSSFVTPKIIKVLFVLFTIWTAIIALVITVIGFRTGGLAGGLFTLIIIVPIFVLLTLGIYRVILEAFMVVFRIYEETRKLRENSDRASLG
jgi:Domain of unknown function (DUF4282)